jgi:regulation of enolase protein 1 (concanavalin A-like superfamily)
MQRGRYVYLAALIGSLACAASAPRAAHAAAVPSKPVAGVDGWSHADIGDPSLAGDTKYDAATGKWTILGSGSDLWGSDNDHFQFAYTPIKGDGSVSARLLSTSGGHLDDGWEKIGVMVRSDLDDTADSSLSQTEMTNRNGGIYWHFRPDKAVGSQEIHGRSSREFPLFMRTQRVGNDIAGFISADGTLWRNIGWTLNVGSMSDTAFFGLSVMAHDDATMSTAVWDNVSATAGLVSVYGLQANGGDKTATLKWLPLKGATSYVVRRGPANVGYDELTAGQLVSITKDPVKETTFTDSDAALTAGRYLYCVTALVNGVESFPVVVRATVGGPSSNVAGYTSTNIGKSPERIPELSLDSAVADTGADQNPATGVIKIRGGGSDIGGTADEFNFTHQTVTGNFEVIVKALRFPTFENAHSKGGLMIREDLSPGARHANISLTAEEGLVFRTRASKDQDTVASDPDVTWQDGRNQLNAEKPITFRLTRTGDVIKAEFSLDGTAFTEAAGSPITLNGLAKSVEVGLAISANTPDNDDHTASLRISEMILRDLQITPK